MSKGSVLVLGYDKNRTTIIKVLEDSGCEVDHSDEPVTDLSAYDAVFSFGYRHIIKPDVLTTAKRPIINLHIGYLPYNRGTHPNFWSFVDNTPAGVTIHEMDEGIDTGPIIFQRYVNFDLNMNTFTTTYDELIRQIEGLFAENLDVLIAGNYISHPQRGAGSTHSAKDLPTELFDWNDDIGETLAKLEDRNSERLKRDLDLVDEIENVRSRNNVNWMDLLRIGLTHAPEETKRVLRRINADDGKISDLFKKLGE